MTGKHARFIREIRDDPRYNDPNAVVVFVDRLKGGNEFNRWSPMQYLSLQDSPTYQRCLSILEAMDTTPWREHMGWAPPLHGHSTPRHELGMDHPDLAHQAAQRAIGYSMHQYMTEMRARPPHPSDEDVINAYVDGDATGRGWPWPEDSVWPADTAWGSCSFCGHEHPNGEPCPAFADARRRFGTRLSFGTAHYAGRDDGIRTPEDVARAMDGRWPEHWTTLYGVGPDPSAPTSRLGSPIPYRTPMGELFGRLRPYLSQHRWAVVGNAALGVRLGCAHRAHRVPATGR